MLYYLKIVGDIKNPSTSDKDIIMKLESKKVTKHVKFQDSKSSSKKERPTGIF